MPRNPAGRGIGGSGDFSSQIPAQERTFLDIKSIQQLGFGVKLRGASCGGTINHSFSRQICPLSCP